MIEKNVTEEDVGELFLVRLNKEDLAKMGFYSSTLTKFQYADVFLMWRNDDFSVKFVWKGEDIKIHIQKVSQTPRWIFNYIVEKYIES